MQTKHNTQTFYTQTVLHGAVLRGAVLRGVGVSLLRLWFGFVVAATWAALSLKSCFDLAFNGLIALGLSFTHPLFIAVGTILSTPLNVAVEYALRGVVPDAAEAVGIVAIVASFCMLLGALGSKYMRTKLLPITRSTGSPAAPAGVPAAAAAASTTAAAPADGSPAAAPPRRAAPCPGAPRCRTA